MTSERGFVVLDFGSQVTQLITRRLRELGYYSEIHPFNYPTDKIKKLNPYGIILSGGPNSVYDKNSPKRSIKDLESIAPILGICYGMQLITLEHGGEVIAGEHREYGINTVSWSGQIPDVPQKQKVWMSHGDVISKVPSGFKLLAVSEANHPACFASDQILAFQFHPEVAHTEYGTELIRYFTKNICKAESNWKAPHIVEHLKSFIKEQVKDTDKVLVGLSGGVDSSVVATLLTKTLGFDRVKCIFVNNGLLRKNEFENVLKQYEGYGLNVKGVDASEEFLTGLKGLIDPEQKRKAIGRIFIEVFEKQIEDKNEYQWLAQGTLYPDVIESFSFSGGPSQTIKSHHNVGGLPEKMKLKLLEPVRELFKDEVRKIGKELGLSEELLGRHPFPGPGLSIRIIGEVTKENLKILKEADDIFIQKLREKKLYHNIWQAFCVLLPIKTVGVQGDGRTYDQVLSLRAVTSTDGMTADWYPFESEFLQEVSKEITNKVRGVSRIVYDITSKPPATIEWE